MWLKKRLKNPTTPTMNKNMKKWLLITLVLMMKKSENGDHAALKVGYLFLIIKRLSI